MAFLPLARDAGRIHVCAHRGASAGAPENTLPALEKAAAQGATVAEIDLVLTRDNEIVLLHDEVLDRTTDGSGRVAALCLAEVRRLDAGKWFAEAFAGTRVPTLREALAVARACGMGLLIEIKERTRADLMLECLPRLLREEAALDEVLVISFDHVWLLRLKDRCPALRTELITHARHLDPAGMAERARAASVSIEWDMFDLDDAQALHQAGVAVRVTLPRPHILSRRRDYGFDDEARFARYLRAGAIDMVAGDDPQHVRQLVEGAAPRE